MKIVILAGGFGSRIAEYTKSVPKPMIEINKKPIIQHIINYYMKFGFNDFIVAAGYKSEVISGYFNKMKNKKFNIKVVFTGKKTMTGGRIKRLEPYLKETFMLTYGDGLCNVDLKKLLTFHKKNHKLVTVTAVRPLSRFGVLELKNNLVKNFKEKVQMKEGWINGGFFVMEKNFLKFIDGDKSILEQDPLEKVCKSKQLSAYRHEGFWHCMDTKRDKDNLEKMLKIKKL
jgi:glucose-1-phosphate cytidylyltransferase